MIKIAPNELKIIAQYIHEISGIFLDQSKAYLFETRLSSLAESLGCKSYLDLHQKSVKDASKKIERQIVDAISTNETLFSATKDRLNCFSIRYFLKLSMPARLMRQI